MKPEIQHSEVVDRIRTTFEVADVKELKKDVMFTMESSKINENYISNYLVLLGGHP